MLNECRVRRKAKRLANGRKVCDSDETNVSFGATPLQRRMSRKAQFGRLDMAQRVAGFGHVAWSANERLLALFTMRAARPSVGFPVVVIRKPPVSSRLLSKNSASRNGPHSLLTRHRPCNQRTYRLSRLSDGSVGEVHVAVGVVCALVAEQAGDGGRVLLDQGGMTGEGVAQVVDAQQLDAGLGQHGFAPEVQEAGHVSGRTVRLPKHVRRARDAWQGDQHGMGCLAQLHMTRSSFAVRQMYSLACNGIPA
jgi:hypothetical protein